MDYNSVLNLKKEIAAAMLAKKKSKGPVISVAAGTPAAAFNITNEIHHNVNGVGIGEHPGGEPFIKLFTRNGLGVSPAALWQHYGLTENDMVVEHIGNIEFQSLVQHQRPPYPGVSVGHYKITAGTLGCFVADAKNVVYILSNNHVLANTNKGFFADPVLQPAPLDGGRKKADAIAHLSYLMPLERRQPNTMDAAIAKVAAGIDLHYAVGAVKKVAGTTQPANRMKVEKYGRTTGHTTGRITTRNLDLQVDFDGQLIDFEDQFEIKGSRVKGKRMKFCSGGDSGALILERGTFNAVGLLFAGSADGTTFATPINDVLNAFSVKIL
jgi:hypothetical protein